MNPVFLRLTTFYPTCKVRQMHGPHEAHSGKLEHAHPGAERSMSHHYVYTMKTHISSICMCIHTYYTYMLTIHLVFSRAILPLHFYVRRKTITQKGTERMTFNQWEAAFTIKKCLLYLENVDAW